MRTTCCRSPAGSFLLLVLLLAAPVASAAPSGRSKGTGGTAAQATPAVASNPTHEPARKPAKGERPEHPAGPEDAPYQVAVAYLNALSGRGDESARAYLLGGVTFTAQEVRIPNWTLVGRDPVRKESGYLAVAVRRMHDLDKAGAMALNELLALTEPHAASGGAGKKGRTSRPAKAPSPEEILEPTRRKARRFQEEFPVFAYVARVGKAVYWHPRNPFRRLLESIPHEGRYELEVHRFLVREKGPKEERTWPLRVLRLKTEAYDSGWKILPASDWDPDF